MPTRRNPEARIWVLQYSQIPLPDDMKAALRGFKRSERLESLRSVARLYVRD